MQRSSNEDVARQHALQQFARLEYTIIDARQEEQGNYSSTERQSLDEVILLRRVREALRRLNPDPDYTQEERELALEELSKNRALSSQVQANKQFYALLKDGIKIQTRAQKVSADQSGSSSQQETHKTLRIIEWREPVQNDFTLVVHFWLNGKLGKRCLDQVVFVNGLPFILLEIADSNLSTTFMHIDTDLKKTVPEFFWYNAFIVVADAFTSKMGSLTTPWEHFFQWKRVIDENEAEDTRLDTLIAGTCHKQRLLDIVENFILFDERDGVKKLVAKNHQYLGVNNAIAALLDNEKERRERRQARLPEPEQQHSKLGVFWHTQGSGKSYSMVFFARKVHRTIANDYTFLIVTDRKDLDKQIFQNFQQSSTISEDTQEVQAGSVANLRLLLSQRHLFIFTLIQKFRTDKPGEDYGEVSQRENIIVMADEAHRTQYDTLAKNMRRALPRAAFIGFTGTPLMDGEEQTRATFGRYVSIYNFRRAIDDGVTVPLFYENHTPHMELINGDFQDQMATLLEDARLDERQEQRVAEEFAHVDTFFSKAERLDQVAAHIVKHFMRRGYRGKAMVVSLDKVTVVRIYNRVQIYWQRYQEDLQTQLAQAADPSISAELAERITYMSETKMAVVVSASDGDIDRFAQASQELEEPLDIAYHHQIFNVRKLDEEFKDAANPLRIAFVCAMWITGFDVPCLSTVYLDSPLHGHTLMQTIARANRIYREKITGMIIDYASNMRALTNALKTYAREDSSGYHAGDQPIGDKSLLVQTLRERLAEARQFCQQQGIDVEVLLVQLSELRDRQARHELVRGAVNILVAYDELKQNALLLTSEVQRLYQAILPDAAEVEFEQPILLFQLIKNGIYADMRAGGITEILHQVTSLVRSSVEVQELELRISADTLEPRGQFDLRDVDLGSLETSMRTGYRYSKAEQLRQMLFMSIQRIMQGNPSRISYIERLERAVNRYNEGSANAATDPPLVDPQQNVSQFPLVRAEQETLLDEYASELVGLTGEVAQEMQRHVREGLSEEELAVFDLLNHSLAHDLDEEERSQIKALACTLLAGLRPIFGIANWQTKSQHSSQAYVLIEDTLEELPPRYSEKQRAVIRDTLDLYMRERYKNDGSHSVA